MKLNVLILCLFYSMTSVVNACPAFFSKAQVSPFIGKKRSHLRLFVIAIENQIRVWKEIPLQIDPLDNLGVVDVDDHKNNPNFEVREFDRFVLRPDQFGPEKLKLETAPCGSKILWQLREAMDSSGFAYMAECQGASDQDWKSVQYDPGSNILTSRNYKYEYLPKNQLMFKNMDIYTDGNVFNAARNSNMFLRLNLKKFFTLNFDNAKIRSFVNSFYVGKLGVVANFSFFLKVLFFNINLRMDTTASFFEDSSLIPMRFSAPVENALHPGSGSLYLWEKGSDITLSEKKIAKLFPLANPDLILKDLEAETQFGLTFCKPKCMYTLIGSVGPNEFHIDIEIPKYLVERGFYPQFVPRLKEFESAMQWPSDTIDEKPDTVGMFFDTAHLPKGDHSLNLWLRMSPRKIQSCPLQVTTNIL